MPPLPTRELLPESTERQGADFVIDKVDQLHVGLAKAGFVIHDLKPGTCAIVDTRNNPENARTRARLFYL